VHYWADFQLVHGFRCYDNIARTRNVSKCSMLDCVCCQELMGTLSQRYPDSEQLTAWLNGSRRGTNSFDWHDALNRTDNLMTMIKQYTEVCKQVIVFCIVCMKWRYFMSMLHLPCVDLGSYKNRACSISRPRL